MFDNDKAIEPNPKLAGAYNNRGKAKMNLGQYEEALQDFDKAIKLNPKHTNAYKNSGIAKAELRQHEEALQDFDKAIELKPEYAEAYFYRGNMKFCLAQFVEAIQDYDKAIELNPKVVITYYIRGFLKAKLGQIAGAIKDYDKVLELNPKYAEVYRMRGTAKFHLKQFAEAIQDYDKAIELNPEDVDAYNNRGFTKSKQGQTAEAIKDYNKALELNPSHAPAYNNRGLAKYDLGQTAEAIKDFDKAIELNPKEVRAYYSRGSLNAELRRHAEAIKDYDKVLELNPVDAEAYRKRGNAKHHLRKFAEAIQDYDKAIELNPIDADAYSYRGLAKYTLEQTTEAIQDYDKVLELNPSDPDAYTDRGIAKANLRQYQEAIQDYDKALELNPNYTLASDNRRIAINNLRQQKLEKILKTPKNTGIYLNTIWGRKQTPDQQPVYIVEREKNGLSQSIGLFFKRGDKPHSSWFGKIGYHSSLFKHDSQSSAFTFARRKSAFESVKEKIAADLYEYLSCGNYIVPKTRLAELPIENQFTKKHAFTPMLLEEINEGRAEKINEGVFVMSKYIENYQDFEKLTNCILGEDQLDFVKCLEKGKLPEEAIVEGKKIPIKGLMEILAAGRLLADTDVLGGTARNAGFLIERNDKGEPIAVRAVKIDPGCAFNKDLDNLFVSSYIPSTNANVFKQDKRHIQYGNQSNTILWQNLTESQQKQFITAVDAGLNALSNTQEIFTTFVTRKLFEQTPKQRPLPSIKESMSDFEQYLKLQQQAYGEELKTLRGDSRCSIQ